MWHIGILSFLCLTALFCTIINWLAMGDKIEPDYDLLYIIEWIRSICTAVAAIMAVGLLIYLR